MTKPLKAISLWQPWASLWLTPRKVHETRHWATSYRGPLLVHAAKRPPKLDDEDLNVVLRAEFGEWKPAKWPPMPLGAIIGMVMLDACVPTVSREGKWVPAHSDDLICGDWTNGRFAWRRSWFELYPEPIPYKGRQGLFNVPFEVISNR